MTGLLVARVMALTLAKVRHVAITVGMGYWRTVCALALALVTLLVVLIFMPGVEWLQPNVDTSAGHSEKLSITLQVLEQQAERLEVYNEYCFKHAQPSGNVYDMYVIDEYELLFCRLPKVASTNWRRVLIHMTTNASFDWLLKMSGPEVHAGYELKILAPSRHFTTPEVEYRLENYYKVVFVRHPLDRLLSAYNDKFVTNAMKQLYLSDYGYGTEIVRLCRDASWPSARAPEHVTFEEFLCYVTRVPVSRLNIHWRPYWAICSFCQSTWTYDFIGKYETMTADAQILFDQWGLRGVAFPPSYRSKAEHRQTFLTAYAAIPSSLVDAVWARYRPDFEMFGYQKFPDLY